MTPSQLNSAVRSHFHVYVAQDFINDAQDFLSDALLSRDIGDDQFLDHSLAGARRQLQKALNELRLLLDTFSDDDGAPPAIAPEDLLE